MKKVILALAMVLGLYSTAHAKTVSAYGGTIDCPNGSAVGYLGPDGSGGYTYFYVLSGNTMSGTQESLVSRYYIGGVYSSTCYDASPITLDNYYLGWAQPSSWWQASGVFGFSSFDGDLYSTTDGLTWTVNVCSGTCNTSPTTTTPCYTDHNHLPLTCAVGQFCTYLGQQGVYSLGACSAPCTNFSHPWPTVDACGCALLLTPVDDVCSIDYELSRDGTKCFIPAASSYCN